MRNYLDGIAEFICKASFSDLPLEVIARAKEVLTDTIAVIAAGMQEREVKVLGNYSSFGTKSHRKSVSSSKISV